MILSQCNYIERLQIELEKGKVLNVQMMAKGELRADGTREVFMELNGQSRSMIVRDINESKVAFY